MSEALSVEKFSTPGVCDPSETSRAFCDAKDRHIVPLDGGIDIQTLHAQSAGNLISAWFGGKKNCHIAGFQRICDIVREAV
jgi:hypothetical protein